ncbi:pilus assembly FimT family protein [Pararobbsia silviterrae]|uniref:pilus assembly FimT family protein n=1 Tax=Pararobbsia silviterrae TaxID=1792498 RepID=UPI001314C3E5|nr:hypothetical protein [Pararobbsia silviterrae]
MRSHARFDHDDFGHDDVNATRAPGFGTIEAMLVLAIVAIGALWAAPWIGRWGGHTRVEAASHEWMTLFEHARDEVRRTGRTVAICAAGVGDPASTRVSRRACPDAESSAWCSDASLRDAMHLRPSNNVDWHCARFVALTEDRRHIEWLREWAIDPAIRLSGSPRALVFSPPLGRTGFARGFEIGPRVDADVRDRRAYRCMSIASGGRIRMTEGRCVGT